MSEEKLLPFKSPTEMDKVRENLVYWDDELKKCQQDPLYFFNNYCKVEGVPDLTRDEYDKLSHEEYKRRNTLVMHPVVIKDSIFPVFFAIP